jgi:hypothetical protein
MWECCCCSRLIWTFIGQLSASTSKGGFPSVSKYMIPPTARSPRVKQQTSIDCFDGASICARHKRMQTERLYTLSRYERNRTHQVPLCQGITTQSKLFARRATLPSSLSQPVFYDCLVAPDELASLKISPLYLCFTSNVHVAPHSGRGNFVRSGWRVCKSLFLGTSFAFASFCASKTS